MKIQTCDERQRLDDEYTRATIELVNQVTRTTIAAAGDREEFAREKKKLAEIFVRYNSAMNSLTHHRGQHRC